MGWNICFVNYSVLCPHHGVGKDYKIEELVQEAQLGDIGLTETWWTTTFIIHLIMNATHM